MFPKCCLLSMAACARITDTDGKVSARYSSSFLLTSRRGLWPHSVASMIPPPPSKQPSVLHV
jgi:hypothetical protein